MCGEYNIRFYSGGKIMTEQNKKELNRVKENSESTKNKNPQDATEERGGVDRLEPTRYGDWEKAGRCIDF
jgi:hypothetical protein